MQYTKYLSGLIQGQGAPQLSNQSFGSIMNIIYLEGAIASLEKVKSKNRNPSTKHKYDIWIKDYSEKLESITENMPPDKLFNIMSQIGY